MTLYVTVTWPWTWQFLSLSNDMLEHWIFFVFDVLEVKKVKYIKANAVPLTDDLVRDCHVTLNVTILISVNWHARALKFFCLWRFRGQESQINKSQCCNINGLPCTWLSRDCHVTVTYKVIHECYNIGFYLFDFPDLQNVKDKKNSMF